MCLHGGLLQLREGYKLSRVIYPHRVSGVRFTGTIGRNSKMLRELCGDATLWNVVFVANMWDEVSRDIGKAHEGELSSHFSNRLSSRAHEWFAISILSRYHSGDRGEPAGREWQIQWELVDIHKGIIHITAGPEGRPSSPIAEVESG